MIRLKVCNFKIVPNDLLFVIQDISKRIIAKVRFNKIIFLSTELK